MNKVCIAQADSGVESEEFWRDNYYYDENQINFHGRHISKFGHALIDHTIQKTEQARWAIENAELNPFSTKNRYWVHRHDYVEEWIIFDIFVNLNDEDFLFWKLKYG